MLCCYVFFFSSRRRHTRSLCDWSSDVCSSDLKTKCPIFASDIGAALRLLSGSERRQVVALALTVNPARDKPASVRAFLRRRHRSEERRVGKECRSRRSPYH